ncbi:DUF1040 family protein [Halosegnis longus]|uniref:DUF1040 family protein n=1 Tax=Halosegnis longus TaxID=2216012 RepID=UPI00096AC922|nr:MULTISPECIES: DUF1040 family protein [Halobacteriales]
MRDPDRIPVTLEAVEEYWQEHPDLRLGQLLYKIANECGYEDPFYMEEDELLAVIEDDVE